MLRRYLYTYVTRKTKTFKSCEPKRVRKEERVNEWGRNLHVKHLWQLSLSEDWVKIGRIKRKKRKDGIERTRVLKQFGSYIIKSVEFSETSMLQILYIIYPVYNSEYLNTVVRFAWKLNKNGFEFHWNLANMKHSTFNK